MPWGGYITFIDSDDFVDKDMLYIMHDMLQKDKDAMMAMCGTCCTSKEEYVRHGKNYTMSKLTNNDLFNHFFRVHGEGTGYGIYSRLFRKDALEGFSFIEGTVSEDVSAVYWFITHIDYTLITSEKLYYYFDNKSGVTRGKTTIKDLEYIKAFERILKQVEVDKPEYIDAANINYMRSNYTILSKMKLYGFDRNNEALGEEYKKLKSYVRKHFSQLMRVKMPLSRKLLLIIDII